MTSKKSWYRFPAAPLSSDASPTKTKDAYNKLAADFQWPHAFCDLKGFDGPNFKAYGVSGTPTVIAVDSKGNLRGRFAGFTAAQSLMDTW